MVHFFLILTMALLVLLIIGLINPSLVVFHWNRRRFLVILFYGTATFISLLILIIISPSPSEFYPQFIDEPSSQVPLSDRNNQDNIVEKEVTPSPFIDWQGEARKYFTSQPTYPEEFTSLAITLITRYEQFIEITGETDLPDGSLLDVQFRQFSTPKYPEQVDLQTKSVVVSGSFQVTFTPPENRIFSSGPFQIRVSFLPQDQIYQVQNIVGTKGEKLKGSKIRQENEIHVMEDIKEVDFEFEVNSSPLS